LDLKVPPTSSVGLLKQDRFREDAEVDGHFRRTRLAVPGFVVRQERQFRIAEFAVREVRLHHSRVPAGELFRAVRQ
jgi:hypothetical protein